MSFDARFMRSDSLISRAIPRDGGRSVLTRNVVLASARCGIAVAMKRKFCDRLDKWARGSSSAPGLRRADLICERAFLSATRRCFDALLGLVATRLRRITSASASRIPRRVSASSRLRNCERSSWAIARTTGPSFFRIFARCESVGAVDFVTS